jgi:putative spermidine/putrescine transport system permease protein
VFLSVQTSLTAELNPSLVRSARSLGAGKLSVFRHVYWPAIRPGVLSGCILGFAASFDEVVVALFLQGPTTVTLPVRMFTAIQFELTPKVAASASLFILLATLALVAQTLLTARRPTQ